MSFYENISFSVTDPSREIKKQKEKAKTEKIKRSKNKEEKEES